MEKTGITWDSVLMEDMSLEDFRDDDFALFRQQALRSGRLDEDDMKLDNGQLLEKLGLLKKGKVMRAAMMAFHHAIVHKNYARQIPIQISIYPDKIYICNDCIFPADWTTETLMQKHRSYPYNPNIANVFFRAGYIEAWGRGIEKMFKECMKNHVEPPVYVLRSEEIMVQFKVDKTLAKNLLHNDLHNNCTITAQKLPESVSSIVIAALEAIASNPRATRAQISMELNVSERTVSECIATLKKHNCIERIGGNKSGYWKIINE